MKTLNLTLLRMIHLVELEKAEKKAGRASCHKIATQNNRDTSHISQSGFMARDILVIHKNIS